MNHGCRMRTLGLVGAAAWALATWPPGAAAQGSVVKCLDVDGNVTYQDSPCTPGQAGRNVALPKAETREDTTAWDAAAREARVVKGMPKRWVLRARGTPVEIRPGAAREDATEVWRYANADGGLLVGFSGGTVAWVRDDPAARGSAPAATAAAAAANASGAFGASGTASRGAQNRRFVIAGRYCEHVFAEIGPALREEALSPNDGVRYYYEPEAGDPQMRTVFTCVGGKVADVERTLAR
jgi:hypothetical protein